MGGAQVEPERLTAAGEEVVVPLRATARNTKTGNPGSVAFTLVAEVQGGTIVRIRNFASEAEARASARLPE